MDVVGNHMQIYIYIYIYLMNSHFKRDKNFELLNNFDIHAQSRIIKAKKNQIRSREEQDQYKDRF